MPEPDGALSAADGELPLDVSGLWLRLQRSKCTFGN
eukprot:COSAG04_NODE_367_length_15823_cov_6.139977_4_plen_36_part_00